LYSRSDMRSSPDGMFVAEIAYRLKLFPVSAYFLLPVFRGILFLVR